MRKDNIYLEKEKQLKATLGFLKAIKSNLSKNLAVEIAECAADNYILSIYKDVFKGTKPGTQNRFNRFRNFYENYSSLISYCEIVESTKNKIEVLFHRCPYFEILKNEKLSHFAESSCNSDLTFTNKLMP